MYSKFWEVFTIALLAAAGCVLTACGGGASGGGPANADEPAVTIEPTTGATDTGALPELADLADTLKAPSQLVRWRTGTDYEQELPHQGLASSSATIATFAPSGDGPAIEPAYCIYSFNLAGLASAAFRGKWYYSAGTENQYSLYLGVSDFATGCWEWHQINHDEYVNLPDTGNYQRADGLCLVAVVMLGTCELRLGNLGFSSAGLYDEIEPNNAADQAQPLPPAPVYAFRGSLGTSAADSSGYDGGWEDYFELTAGDGELLTVVVHPTGNAGIGEEDSMLITNAQGVVFSGILASSGPTFARGIDYAADQAPYLLRLFHYRTDYEIYVTTAVDALAPVAEFSVSPQAGSAPLEVTLDASASHDENDGGAIVRYDWDFEGDGLWDVIGGTEAIVEHTYASDGVYYPLLRVGNTLGLGHRERVSYVSPGPCTVTVGDSGFDEIEDNDELTLDSANALPAVPFSGYTGSVSHYDNYGPAYDGDWIDCFTFYAEAGQPCSFTDEYFYDGLLSDNGQNVMLAIFSLDRLQLAAINPDQKSITFVPEESAQYFLRVMACSTRAHNYSLSAVNKYPPSDIVIEADVDCGLAPLTVNLSATASDPDSATLTYGWSDSGYYPLEKYGYTSETTMTFRTAGTRTACCIVTDETGLRLMKLKYIYVWPYEYNEREWNDYDYQAQLLPELPVSGFLGSLAGYHNKGYNGHFADWFELADELVPGLTLSVTAGYEPVDETFELVLCNSYGTALASCDAATGSASLDYVVTAADSQPYLIRLESAEDYALPNIVYQLSVSTE
ncbi:PKD domain-containing protein [bacterium]|nr:PKD domain-containing protein [bacterium]